MIQFLLALACFVALHSIPAIPAFRQALVARLGRRAYLTVYSLVSLLALAWVFHAAFQLDYAELWSPQPWHAWVTLIVSPIALFLLFAGLLSPNPASISLRGRGKPGAITTITRHPVLWGFALWALGHLVANGDLRSLMLFGGFALFSAFGIIMAERRSKRLWGQWQAIAATTSILPLAALFAGRARWRFDRWESVAAAATLVVTAWLLLGGHAAMFGADPLAMATS